MRSSEDRGVAEADVRTEIRRSPGGPSAIGTRRRPSEARARRPRCPADGPEVHDLGPVDDPVPVGPLVLPPERFFELANGGRAEPTGRYRYRQLVVLAGVVHLD